MRRFLPFLIALALLSLPGCGRENAAERDAVAQVETLATALSRALFWKTEEFGFFVTQQEGVELLSIDGQKRSQTAPLHMVVRVVGTATEGGGFYGDGRPTPLPDAVRCFAVTVFYSDVTFHGVDCPRTAPLTFPSPPAFPPHIIERLKDTLPRKPDPEKVREAIRRLDLDRRITQEILERVGVIGVALREGADRTCLYARIRPGEVEVWYPHRIVPGGDSDACTALGAVNGDFERANH